MTVRRLLLRPEDVPASRDDFEVVGVFNPGRGGVQETDRVGQGAPSGDPVARATYRGLF